MNLAGWFLTLLVFGAKEEALQLQKLLRWTDDPLLRQAVDEAAAHIEKKTNCSLIFRPGAVEALKAAKYRFVRMGQPRLRLGPKPHYSVVNAATIREQNLILINSEGAFFRPRMTIDDAHFNYGLNDRDLRAFVLLHELGHLMGRFEPDADNPELSQRYSDLVLRSCF
jgi:hypothetical protein